MELDPKKIKPVGDRVLVLKDPWQEASRGGVLLGGTNRPRPVLGTVLAVGPGAVNPATGRRIPTGVQEGDRVCFPPWASTTESVDPRRQHAPRPGVLTDRLILIRDSEIYSKILEE